MPSTPPLNHLEERDQVASALVAEIFGPHPSFSNLNGVVKTEATPINTTEELVFDNWDQYNARHVDAASGEEILKTDLPTKMYGAGILFPSDELKSNQDEQDPIGSELEENAAAAEASAGMRNSAGGEKNPGEEKLSGKLSKIGERLGELNDINNDSDSDDLDGLRLARIRSPRSMGVTFACDLVPTGLMEIQISGARYRLKEDIRIRKEKDSDQYVKRNWWVRVPVHCSLVLKAGEIGFNTKREVKLEPKSINGLDPLNLSVKIISRPGNPTNDQTIHPERKLITVTLVNRTNSITGRHDRECLFQSRFTVEVKEVTGLTLLRPLIGERNLEDEEEQSMSLLYHGAGTYASGHGCAGAWDKDPSEHDAVRVVAEAIPTTETPTVTPRLIDPETQEEIRIAMKPLAQGSEGWLAPLEKLHRLYEEWIEKIEKSGREQVSESLQGAVDRHLSGLHKCSNRIREGLNLLKTDPEVVEVFRLTNRAMLLQQIAGGIKESRNIKFDPKLKKVDWTTPIAMPSLESDEASSRSWRPFQIAFLLMSIPGIWEEKSPDRDIADLIWFPTGGGKTEAYLAASAFAMFTRRLIDPEDTGTNVIMRYTLRLLTSQQFQRAAGLICAMESIRLQEQNRLGKTKYTIGIWVGGDTTPNKIRHSIDSYNKASSEGPDAYAHVLLRCPWCAASIGPRRQWSEHGSKKYICEGLRSIGRGDSRDIQIHCPDTKCTFHQALPLSVVDESIYDNPPSLLIGTVDKFAMLAWRPEARRIFGIDSNGKQIVTPPSLIIQDELHLISGPLGSMVGLYEGLIEELCTDRRRTDRPPVRPKLVASTATTRASTRQIRDLYARPETAIFPPPGLSAGDSFFATYDRFPKDHENAGQIKPGRMYLGVLAKSYGSGLTVNVRSCSAIISAAGRIGSDPWWSLLVFYNSLRELGSGLTLFGADIPERLRDIQNRWFPGKQRRYLSADGVLELTGRLNNSDIPRALERLEQPNGKREVVDACLASNIIEVGVDVPRLGIMAVVGQPKNTAQYIQATGRVGRSKPGLVVIMYDNQKPRDLSHYEQFQDYHDRLYAAVEPSSVTPFTLPVMERALHGVLIAWIRQKMPLGEIKMPRKLDELDDPIRKSIVSFAKHFRERMKILYRDDPASFKYSENVLLRVLKRRTKDWIEADPSRWSNKDMSGQSGDRPLMRFYGKPCIPEWEDEVWETPTSMRGVDAECPARIYTGAITNDDSDESSDEKFDDLDEIFAQKEGE